MSFQGEKLCEGVVYLRSTSDNRKFLDASLLRMFKAFLWKARGREESIQHGSYDMKGHSHKSIVVLIYYLTVFFQALPLFYGQSSFFP